MTRRFWMRACTIDGRRWHSAVLLAAVCVVVLVTLRGFLPVHNLPSRGDPALSFQGSDLTPQWFPWLKVSLDALWRTRTLPYWDPYRNAGAPLFEVPEAGVVSLATILGAVVIPEAAIKWSMLVHVFVGMIGTFHLARRLSVAPTAGAVGALAFGLNPYLLDHFRVGHLSHILPMCLAPWVLLCAWNALACTGRWWRHAAAAGIVAGLQVLEGGTSIFLYTMLALLLLMVTCPGPASLAWTARLAGVGIVTMLCVVGTAAPQLLPMLAYLELTGRADGFGFEISSQAISEVAHPYPGVLTILVIAAGVVTLALNDQRRAAAWLASIAALGSAASAFTPVYFVLWKWLPGFHYQRIPQRAVVMLWIAAPVLVAAGLDGLAQSLRRVSHLATMAVAVVATACAYQWWTAAPQMPPMSDPRVALQQNASMQWVRAHADGSRVHVWESPDRHWGSDNVTVPLGLEAITSYTPSEHHDYLPGDFDPQEHRTFIGDSYRSPARFWGLLNVRYVLSSTPRTEPGFHLATMAEACPVEVCQPAKAAGRFVYENDQWQPRGWIAPRAIAIVGTDDAAFRAALDVLHRADFDPRRVAVLQVRAGELMPAVDAIFTVDVDLPAAVSLSSAAAAAALTDVLAAAQNRGPAAAFTREDNNTISFAATARGWLVASEKAAIYPGWRVVVNGSPVAPLRADGVLAAVPVAAGDVVRFEYAPPRLSAGVALFAATAAGLVLGLFVEGRRR